MGLDHNGLQTLTTSLPCLDIRIHQVIMRALIIKEGNFISLGEHKDIREQAAATYFIGFY